MHVYVYICTQIYIYIYYRLLYINRLFFLYLFIICSIYCIVIGTRLVFYILCIGFWNLGYMLYVW